MRPAVLPREGGTGGLVPFPGQLWSLTGGLRPLSVVPEAGGAPCIWTSLALCLQPQSSALVRARGCWCFTEVKEPWR